MIFAFLESPQTLFASALSDNGLSMLSHLASRISHLADDCSALFAANACI